MEKLVQENNILFAKIIKNYNDYECDTLFCNEDDAIQINLKHFVENEKSGAHFHNPYDEKTNRVDEVLIINKGSVRIDFYNEIGAYIKSVVAKENDIVIMYRGGHNIVAQDNGKYLSINLRQMDSTRIIGANNLELIVDND